MKENNINIVFQDAENFEVYYVVNFVLDQLNNKEELQELYNKEREQDDYWFDTWLDKLIKTKKIKSCEVLNTWTINY